ncbi:MAG: hypothetical protein ACRDHW_18910 [Ktedonobacteraceae bacterium]
MAHAFLAASRGGDFSALLAVLDPDIVFRADRVAVSQGAAGEIHGAVAVAQQIIGRLRWTRFAQPVLVDGKVGLVVAPRGHLMLLVRLTIKGDKIAALDALADPVHLHQVQLAMLSD